MLTIKRIKICTKKKVLQIKNFLMDDKEKLEMERDLNIRSKMKNNFY